MRAPEARHRAPRTRKNAGSTSVASVAARALPFLRKGPGVEGGEEHGDPTQGCDVAEPHEIEREGGDRPRADEGRDARAPHGADQEDPGCDAK